MPARITATLTLTYGDATPPGNTLMKQNFTFAFDYAEESTKTVHVPASSTDFPITLDTVSAPKFLFARTKDTDVTLKLSDSTDTVPTALAAASGWLMLCNPDGQDINRLLVTTGATPAGGAHIEIISFE